MRKYRDTMHIMLVLGRWVAGNRFGMRVSEIWVVDAWNYCDRRNHAEGRA